MTVYEYMNEFIIYIIILILILLIFTYHFKPELFTTKHLEQFGNTCDNSCSNMTEISDMSYNIPSGLEYNAQHKNDKNKYFNYLKHYYLRHFHIMTAYNCCSSGDINGCLELCALENSMNMGARCLDFEIYNKNGLPIVATSSKMNSNFTTDSHNHLIFDDVLKTIMKHAFSDVPNSSDPLLLHFRINSNTENTVTMLNNMAISIKSLIPLNYRLNDKYGNGCRNYDVTSIPINRLKRKIVLMCDFNNQVDQSELYKLINISALCDNFSTLTETDFSSKSQQSLKGSSKRTLILSKPDQNNHNNISVKSFVQQKNIGISMIGMRFQKYDNASENQSFKKYLSFFSNTAFVIKSNNLLDLPIVLEEPKKQNPKVTYGTTTFDPLPGVDLPIEATQI